MSKSKPFYLVTSLVFFALLLPFYVRKGMFLDGVFYANISRNLAIGMGDIWSMQYSLTQNKLFCGHPFLVFWIQSFFFQILGDHFLIERFFALLTALLSAWSIHALWQTLFPKKTERSFSWLPLFLWITVPLTFWAYRNNILENTLTVFVLLTTICSTKAIQQRNWQWWALAAFLLLGSFLSKGVVGLFPLVIPTAYFLAFRQTSIPQAIIQTIYFIGFTGLFFIALIGILPEALDQLTCYMNTQFFPSLRNELEITVDSRFSIIEKLLLEIIFPIILVLLFIIKNRKTAFYQTFPNWRKALFLLLIGMAASLPIMVSLKQRKFYLLPSIPFYVMAASAMLLPFVQNWTDQLTLKWRSRLQQMSYTGLLLLVIGCCFLFGSYSRYEKKIRDIYTISEYLPKQTIVSVPVAFLKDYSFSAYMHRVGQLSVRGDTDEKYRITRLEAVQDSFSIINYEKVPLDLSKYQLYKRK